jgi:hypothetical protein
MYLLIPAVREIFVLVLGERYATISASGKMTLFPTRRKTTTVAPSPLNVRPAQRNLATAGK